MTALLWLESGPVALIVRASAVLIVAFALHRSLRGASALSRHALWASVMLSLLALPLLQLQLPRLGIPGWRISRQSVEALMPTAPQALPGSVVLQGNAPINGGAPHSVERSPATTTAPLRSAPIPWQVVLILSWCIGGIAVLVPIVVGMRRARRLVGDAIPVHNRRMLVRLDHLRRITGVRRHVELAVSERVRTPMAWGYRRPAILLPMDAADWTTDRFDAVLVHELVHIRRGDTIHQIIARIASACYWFHPMVWQGARLAAAARERACDAAVLGFGTRPSHYARHLMELSEHGTTMTSMPALARLHHPNLEDRVMNILRHAPVRQSPWRAVLAVAAVLTWTLAVAAVGPVAAQRPAPPAPPAAPAAVMAEPPTPPAAPAVPLVQAPYTVHSEALPPIPAAPAPPAPPTPPADCATRSSRGVVVERSGVRGQPTRMIRRNLDDGRAICLAIRGALAEDFTLSPLGTLPAGVVVTLEVSRDGVVQRMEITGAADGNTHRWLVNGAERPFNSEAREWRDAMLAVLSVGFEQSRVRSAAVVRESKAIRAHAQEVAKQARSMSGVQARRIAEQAAALEDQARSISAQRELTEAAVARVHEQVAAIEAERSTRVEAAEVAVHVAKVRERAMADSRRMQEQRAAVAEVNARVREVSEQMRVTERALTDRVRLLQAESRRVAEVRGERATRVEPASPRVREIDATLEPLERRLQEIIERVGP